MLKLARLYTPVYHTSSNGLPLGAELNESVFKPVFLDVGLMNSMCALSMKEIHDSEELTLVNAGKVTEQFIGQHLVNGNEPYILPELYYWVRQNPGSNAEVDFVIPHAGMVIPVEVKAGKTGVLKSLHRLIDEVI